MVGICFVVTIHEGFLSEKFSPGFIAIGTVLMAILFAPTLFFYLKNIEEGEIMDPFILDLRAHHEFSLRLAEDTHYAKAAKELDDLDSPEKKDSPPY